MDGCSLMGNATSTGTLSELFLATRLTFNTVYRDPIFGSCIKRVTDRTQRASDAVGHIYSQLQAWNSDEKLILMNNNEIIDAHSLELAHTIDFKYPAYGRVPVWSPVNPNVLYYIDGISPSNALDPDGFICPANRLTKYTLSKSGTGYIGTRDMLHCFSEYASIDHQAGWQDLSENGRYIPMV